jgi:hypothetical protein
METATVAVGNGLERYPRRWLAAVVMIGAATMDLIDLTMSGMGFSPLGAGLTLLVFSIGSFLPAGAAVPLAQRFGRLVLSAGGVLMAAGMVGVLIGASHVGNGSDPWPVVPGLVLAGAGLSLLIIPLLDVVLAAVPHEVAGGAGGMFSTAQQLGGALGVALVGTVFFGQRHTRSPRRSNTRRRS